MSKTHKAMSKTFNKLAQNQTQCKFVRFDWHDVMSAMVLVGRYVIDNDNKDIDDVHRFIAFVAAGFCEDNVADYFDENSQLIFTLGDKAIDAMTIVGAKNTCVYARLLSAIFYLWVEDFHQLKNKLKAVWALDHLPDELHDSCVPNTWARLMVKWGCWEYFKATALADLTEMPDVWEEITDFLED